MTKEEFMAQRQIQRQAGLIPDYKPEKYENDLLENEEAIQFGDIKMSIATRRNKINQAVKSVIIHHSNGGLVASVQGSERVYRVTTERLPKNQTLKFGNREVTSLCYQSTCQCEGNKHPHTCCYHVLAAFQASWNLAGFSVYKCDNPQNTFKLMNLGASFIKLYGQGGGVVTLAVIRRKVANQRDAYQNLINLLASGRIGLENTGDKIPIAYKVELVRMSDGKLAFASGKYISRPMVEDGKLVEKANENWLKFINQILPQRMSFRERVELMRGSEDKYID